MNIYFITTQLLQERYRHAAGLHSDTNIVIAESEENAIDIMYNLMKPYVLNRDSIQVAKGANLNALTGHGQDVQQYLITPSLRNSQTQWQSLEKLVEHYIRYNYHIYDKDGEVELLNYYQHFGNDEFPNIPHIPGSDEGSSDTDDVSPVIADCNDLVSPGNYNLLKGSANTPINDAFHVVVSVFDNTVMQTAYLADSTNTRVYYRVGTISDKTYTSWMPVLHETEVTQI